MKSNDPQAKVQPKDEDNAQAVDESPTKQAPSAFKPNKWELFLAGSYVCPLCSCCLWFGLGWLFVFIFLAKVISVGDDIINFDEAAVKSSIIVQEYYGFTAAVGDVPGCEDEDHEEYSVCVADEKCEWKGRSCQEKSLCEDEAKSREEPLLYDGDSAWVAIVYEAVDGGNILDNNILQQISDFEKVLLTDANGAEYKGEKSGWADDWCLKAYPTGDESSTGKCKAPSSILNVFSMTEEGRTATKEQVEAGYSNAPVLACICSHEDSLCEVCNEDGSVKDQASWPTAALSCMQTRRAELQASTSTSSCTSTGASTEAEIIAYFQSFCASKPSCQWAPPGASVMCSSTAFYRATDSNSLVTGEEKTAALDKMCDSTNTMWSALRKSLLPTEFDCSTRQTSFARTTFVAGDPGDVTDTEFEEEYVTPRKGWYRQEQLLENEIEKDGTLRVMLFSAATVFSQFFSIFIRDMLLSTGSLVLVWLYIFWTLESAFLASCAMFEIVFSLPVACSLWTVIMGQKIDFFQMLTVYMILGIGADDAFILFDAWLQAPFSGEVEADDLERRFAWAYRRSFKAMLVTTATTCGSFLIGACSVLPQVQRFCVFAAVVVLVDWLFCESFFASAVMIYERYISTTTRSKGTCMGPGCCCGGVRVAASSCAGVKYPPLDAPQKRSMERFCEGPLFNFLYKGRYALITFWVVVSIAAGTNAGVQLRTATASAPIGRESEDATRGVEVLQQHFTLFGVPTVSVAYGLDPDEPVGEWGETADDNIAQFNAAAAAKITTPTGQMEVLNLCRSADQENMRCESKHCLISGQATSGQCAKHSSTWITSGVYLTNDVLCQTGRYCFMEEFARYWAYYIAGADCLDKTTQATCPSASCNWDSLSETCYSSKTEHDFKGLTSSEFIAHLASEEYTEYLSSRETVRAAANRDFDSYTETTLTGFRLNSAKTALTFAWLSFNATYPRENTAEEANDIYDRWEDHHESYNPTVGGFQTTELYLFMVTQNEMVKAAIMGVALSLVISFFVLILTTLNWWVALLGLTNICGITVVFLGIMPLLGWELGENECIFLIAVVGLSVDYTVHLLHVYKHATAEDRLGRSRQALAEMGISVTNSAITTLLAASILFLCGFYFFFQFGAFIFFVIGFSIIMSIFFLIPITMTIGPQKDQGDIQCVRRLCKRRATSKQ